MAVWRVGGSAPFKKQRKQVFDSSLQIRLGKELKDTSQLCRDVSTPGFTPTVACAVLMLRHAARRATAAAARTFSSAPRQTCAATTDGRLSLYQSRFSRPAGSASPALDRDGPGWMGRPATDAKLPLEDADELFPARTPADVDREHFREAPSVRFWNEWSHDDTKSPSTSVSHILSQIAAATKTPADARYWAYHVFRSSWFIGQGAAGMLASSLAGMAEGKPSLSKARAGAGAANRLVIEATQVYTQDLARINSGTHKPPWDMDPKHRQFNPVFVADRTVRFLSEAKSTLEKHTASAKQENPTNSKVWLNSPLYPDYYLNTFHYQTDGWLSKESAKVYEVSTETLFVGRQDAMQRTALAPLREWFNEMNGEEASANEDGHDKNSKIASDGENVNLLEMACGTGRFLTFTRDNYPKMNVTGLDLSPFYLAEARENAVYWERFRGEKLDSKSTGDKKIAKDVAYFASGALRNVRSMASAAGFTLPPLPGALRSVMAWESSEGVDGQKTEETGGDKNDVGTCEFTQAAAESMPFPDESFHVVTCVYLFHELPPAVRKQVAKEAARVLKPGGVFILADSIQLGDRPLADKHLGRFGDFNEPYYRSWLRECTVELFGSAGAGLAPWTKELCSSTKVVSFRKPKKQQM
jgi:ubiquinone/menaquinone biosynthesis C-methylase UbiE|tara:strand:+ start:199 stop:2124 length:1926 start_codon:yes stop_codon:yes gene_type:complete